MMKNFKLPPVWLLDAAEKGGDLQSLPLQEMLNESLFYPGAGCDFMPIEFFAGHIFSFIYVDYMAHDIEPLRMFYETMEPSQLFRFKFNHLPHIRLIGAREVKKEEFISSFWKQQEYKGKRLFSSPKRYTMNRDGSNKIGKDAIWCIFELDMPYMQKQVRKDCDDIRGHRFIEDVRPDYFFDDDMCNRVEKLRYSDYIPRKTIVSLLYIFNDGVSTYDALYYHNKTHPSILTLIQTFGFSSNWTNFADEDDILGQLVTKNPFGVPEYLMYGGWGNHTKESPGRYGDPLWKSYSEYIDAIEGINYLSSKNYAGIWRNGNSK